VLSQGSNVTMTSDGNTTGVKIVSFGMNPSILSTEDRMKELIAENEALKSKLKQINEQSILGAVDPKLTEEKKSTKTCNAIHSKNVDLLNMFNFLSIVLQTNLQALEKKFQNLSEAYDYETEQLQTALTKLFGFHVTLTREPQSQLRLQSVYSTDSDDLFIFQVSIIVLSSIGYLYMRSFPVKISKTTISNEKISNFKNRIRDHPI